MKPRPETTLGKWLILEARSKHRTNEHLAKARRIIENSMQFNDQAGERLRKAHQYFIASVVVLVISLLMVLFG